MTAPLLAGLLLGVLSRVDETEALVLPVSDDATWIAAAFAAGALRPRAAVAAGVGTLTAANLAYYAWIAATEPGVPLQSVAGSPWHWLALGALTGAVFGPAGALATRGTAPLRAAAIVLPLLVVALDHAGALRLLMP
jgi:hypothetical protein